MWMMKNAMLLESVSDSRAKYVESVFVMFFAHCWQVRSCSISCFRCMYGKGVSRLLHALSHCWIFVERQHFASRI